MEKKPRRKPQQKKSGDGGNKPPEPPNGMVADNDKTEQRTSKPNTGHGQQNPRPRGRFRRWVGCFGIILADYISPIAVAVFTGAICIIILYQWRVTQDQLDEMKKTTAQVDESISLGRETLISGQRAWIAPIEAHFAEPFAVGKNARVRILYDNAGREPAIDVSVSASGGLAPSPPEGAGFGQLQVNAFSTVCYAPTESTKLTAYPSTGKACEHVFFVPAAITVEEVKNGAKILYVNGCFRYSTFGQRHLSQFCFFLKPEYGKEFATWTWRNCPRGNYAN